MPDQQGIWSEKNVQVGARHFAVPKCANICLISPDAAEKAMFQAVSVWHETCSFLRRAPIPYNLLLEIITMKTALLVVCVFCATAAFGQNAGAPSLQSLQFASHQMTAGPGSMAHEQSLLGNSSVVVAQGELPLWEVAPKIHEVPLGDAAREQKKLHANDKKAKKVWDNQ